MAIVIFTLFALESKALSQLFFFLTKFRQHDHVDIALLILSLHHEQIVLLQRLIL